MTDTEAFSEFEQEQYFLRQSEDVSQRHWINEEVSASRLDLVEERYGLRADSFKARAGRAPPGLLLLIIVSLTGILAFLLLS